MNKWIYLKSNCPADALALSSVIATSRENFNIVRKSYTSQFFRGLDNVVINFYAPAEDSELIVIEETGSDSWKQKYDTMASLLGVENNGSYEPYCGFAKHIVKIEERLELESIGLLYLNPHPDQNLDLALIDNLVRLLEFQGIKSISGGTCMLPCIKGTLDLREVIDFAVLCAILPKLQFVITTEKSIATICEAFNKNAFVVSHIDKLTVNGIYMSDANQILNYINFKTKNI
jgi:hypothetical protein